jgi:multidrug efflux pump subunit AcrA (membrane-fusion protein)
VIVTKVSVAGRLIDPVTRAFYVEGKLPADKDLRPNQVALVNIQDYNAPNAITIPLNTIQNDEKGKYIMIAAKEGNRLVAKKRQIVIGQLYGDKLEVKSGLQPGDVVITEGFQNLYEGQPITTDAK